MHASQLISQPDVRFFSPDYCPDCRAPLAGAGVVGSGAGIRCARCGLPLGNADAVRLADLLSEADRALAAMRRQRQPVPAAAAGRPPVAGYQPPAGRSEPRQARSGAAILLGLGALCLVIAAVVFLSVSWTALSLAVKVAVLAAVSAVLAGAAATVTGRGLRGSAEALWTITFADLALDLFAARQAHLAGLHTVSPASYTAGAASLLALLALACCLATRRSVIGRALISSEVVLGAASFSTVLATVNSAIPADWLALTIAVAALIALALLARAGRLPVTERLLTAGAGLPWLGLVISGLDQIGRDRFVPQLWHGHANQLPAAVLLAMAVAGSSRLVRPAGWRTAFGAAGIGLALFGVGAGTVHYLVLPLALAVTIVVAAAASYNRHPIWRPAAVLALAGSLGIGAIALAGAASTGAGGALQAQDWLWLRAADRRLAGWPAIPVQASLVLLVVAGAVLIARRELFPDRVLPWASALAGPVAVAISVNAGPNPLIGTLGWLAAAGCSAAVADRFDNRALRLVPLAALVIGLAGALAADLASLVGFAASVLLTVAASRRWLARATDRPLRLAAELVAIGQLFGAVAAGWHRVQPDQGAPAVAGLLVSAAVLAAIGAWLASRRWWVWLACAAVVGAIWIEAAAHQLRAPEPYSLPAGTLALAFGWQASRRSPALSSWLGFGPGLLVLTVPSLLVALREPVSWRAALVGAVALVLTLAAARVRLQAPLLIGAAELALLAVREVGPYALALPRWLALGVVGLLLLGIGVTWEEQLASLRQARHRFAGLR